MTRCYCGRFARVVERIRWGLIHVTTWQHGATEHHRIVAPL